MWTWSASAFDTEPTPRLVPAPVIGPETLADANVPGVGFEKIVTAALCGGGGGGGGGVDSTPPPPPPPPQAATAADPAVTSRLLQTAKILIASSPKELMHGFVEMDLPICDDRDLMIF